MKKRLFVALPLPGAFLDVFGEYHRQFSADPAIRWTPKENLHITAHFIGWVDDAAVSSLARNIGELFRSVKPFTLSFKEISFAPPGNPPRMVWAVFSKSAAFESLALSLADATREFARERNSLEPIPHVTLARFSDPRTAQRTKLIQPQLPEPAFEPRSCWLMESHLSRSGPVYEVLETVPNKL